MKGQWDSDLRDEYENWARGLVVPPAPQSRTTRRPGREWAALATAAVLLAVLLPLGTQKLENSVMGDLVTRTLHDQRAVEQGKAWLVFLGQDMAARFASVK